MPLKIYNLVTNSGPTHLNVLYGYPGDQDRTSALQKIHLAEV